MDAATRAALSVAPGDLGAGSMIGLTIVPDSTTIPQVFADALLAEYRACLAAGRAHVVFIVPVGPVGQFDLLAAACNATRQDLSRLVLINMDDYLAEDGDLIPTSDPLSFRAHMERHFFAKLDPELAPPRSQNIFPDPRDPTNVQRTIDQFGGVDACFGGVGITGHLAFNDPSEPDAPDDVAAFARLPTRMVTLSRETLTINAITAARGNIARMPRTAVTVGMAEILAARKVRLFMHRPWHCAMIRRMLHGPITSRVPASLLQRHLDAHVTITRDVALPPEPDWH